MRPAGLKPQAPPPRRAELNPLTVCEDRKSVREEGIALGRSTGELGYMKVRGRELEMVEHVHWDRKKCNSIREMGSA